MELENTTAILISDWGIDIYPQWNNKKFRCTQMTILRRIYCINNVHVISFLKIYTS